MLMVSDGFRLLRVGCHSRVRIGAVTSSVLMDGASFRLEQKGHPLPAAVRRSMRCENS